MLLVSFYTWNIFLLIHFTIQFNFFTVALRYNVGPGFDVKNVWWRILENGWNSAPCSHFKKTFFSDETVFIKVTEKPKSFFVKKQIMSTWIDETTLTIWSMNLVIYLKICLHVFPVGRIITKCFLVQDHRRCIFH